MLLLLVLGLNKYGRDAAVWDSDDLTIENINLDDLLRYHNEVSPLNIEYKDGKYVLVRPKIPTQIIENQDFILAIDNEYCYVYCEGCYTSAFVDNGEYSHVPVRNFKGATLMWIAYSDYVYRPTITRLRPITRREFRRLLATDCSKLQFHLGEHHRGYQI